MTTTPGLQHGFAADRGRFLCLEGPDGSGKSTQAARLVDWLRDRGSEVVACRDPGGTPLGDRLRAILLDRSELEIGLRAEALLYMASRAQLVEEVIRPALERGAVVVSDRFLLSNIVYQGIAGGLEPGALWNVGRFATGGCLPNLTLLLDVDPEVSRRRRGPARDRIEDRGDDYLSRVVEGFRAMAASSPFPIQVIDASRPFEDVAQAVRNEVARVLGIDPRS